MKCVVSMCFVSFLNYLFTFSSLYIPSLHTSIKIKLILFSAPCFDRYVMNVWLAISVLASPNKLILLNNKFGKEIHQYINSLPDFNYIVTCTITTFFLQVPFIQKWWSWVNGFQSSLPIKLVKDRDNAGAKRAFNNQVLCTNWKTYWWISLYNH